MNVRRVKMNLIARGNTAEVFDIGDGKVLKLFVKNYSPDAVKREFFNSTIMNKTSLNTPKAFEIVETEGRSGIVYTKLEGPDLLSELMKNPCDVENAGKILSELAQLQLELHKHSSDKIISYKEFLSYFDCPGLDKLPDENTICHGDFHIGNIIRNKDGKLYVIDFMNLCRGPKEYDIARTYVLMTENSPEPEQTGNAYLSLMNCSYDAIEPYLESILLCRKKEKL